MIWKKEISKRQAFWSRSWFEGTFRDHARYENYTSSYRSRMKRQVQRFLGMPESRWHSRLSNHESYDLQAIHAAVENRLSDWVVNREIPIEDDAWAARYREVEVKHGVHQSLLAEGIRLYRLPNDQRRALMIEQSSRAGSRLPSPMARQGSEALRQTWITMQRDGLTPTAFQAPGWDGAL